MKTYVKVNTVFDTDGYMHPRFIIWDDGRIFSISAVKELYYSARGERYTVDIQGEDRYLYHERPDDLSSFLLGRWFVRGAESA